MKIKIKGYLHNITDNELTVIDTTGIKNKSGIIYIQDEIKHSIKIKDNILYLIRENKEFYNVLKFIKNKTEESEYLIKEYNKNIYINIKTIDLIIDNDKIFVSYEIEENRSIFEYKIEIR